MKTVIQINASDILKNELGELILSVLKSIPIIRQSDNTLKLMTGMVIRHDNPTVNIFNAFLQHQKLSGVDAYIIDLDQ